MLPTTQQNNEAPNAGTFKASEVSSESSSSYPTNGAGVNKNRKPVMELRALHSTRNGDVLVGHYDDECTFHRDAAALNAQGYNIYSPINPIRPEVITGLNTKPARGGAVGINHIARRTCLPFDIDAIRPKDAPASEQERQEARKVADRLRAFWKAYGVTPTLVESGNGAQSKVAIDLPNNEESTELIKTVLEVLKAEFDTPGPKIDVLFDAARIMRVPGYMNWKDQPSENRPHRQVELLEEGSGLATREMLEAIAARHSEWQEKKNGAKGAPEPAAHGKIAESRAYVERLLTNAGIPAEDWEPASGRAVWKMILDGSICPNAENHGCPDQRTTFAILIMRDGSKGLKCHHANACKEVSWVHFRAMLEKLAAERFDENLETAIKRVENATAEGEKLSHSKAAIALIVLVKDRIQHELFIKRLAKTLGVEPETVNAEVENCRRSANTGEHKSVTLVRASTIKPAAIPWYWKGYIAGGKISTWNGEPGDGKSLISLYIAARVTTGRAWADGQQNPLPPSC